MGSVHWTNIAKHGMPPAGTLCVCRYPDGGYEFLYAEKSDKGSCVEFFDRDLYGHPFRVKEKITHWSIIRTPEDARK